MLMGEDLGQCRKALGSSAEGSYVPLGRKSCCHEFFRSPLDSEITFPFNQPGALKQAAVAAEAGKCQHRGR